jgi:monoamine oxidase
MKPPTTRPVIIIGAGAAGLSAARSLSTRGIKVILLEASHRIGGRIHSIQDDRFPMPVELGAEFVHGVPPETFRILALSKIEALEIDGTSFTLRNGKPSETDQTKVWNELDLFADSNEQDCSFSDFINRHQFDAITVDAATRYVEGFNAAHAKLISARSLAIANEASEKITGNRQFRLAVPYLELAKFIHAQCDAKLYELRLNAEVKSVRWKNGSVTCELTGGEKVEGSAAFITLPLPILKRGIVHFDPAISVKELALSKIEMGQVQRIVITFKERFWEKISIGGRSLENLAFITSDQPSFRTWWTLNPRRLPVLVGWSSGAAYIENVGEQELLNIALKQLASIFQVEETFIREQMQASLFHDWKRDRLFQGAYSYCKTGGVDAPRILAEPLSDTLYFAGEATNWRGHIGTVHGAIESGERAANEFLRTHSRARRPSFFN